MTIELDQTASSSTDLKLYRLHAILTALECAQVPGSGLIQNLDRSCRMITALNWGMSCNSVRAMRS